MPYLIDGHNLIGQIESIHLDDPEDEFLLIQLLNEFLNKTRKSGTVYFDQRAPGTPRKYKLGRLQVEFITSPSTADLAIRKKLRSLRGGARNYTVISSDHEVKKATEIAGAKVIDSHDFVEQLERSYDVLDENDKPERPLTPEDLRFWQQIFEKPPEK